MWNLLDGKKTWLGILLYSGLDVVQLLTVSVPNRSGGIDARELTQLIADTLMIVGTLHKISKGE